MELVTPESSYLAAILRMHMYPKGNHVVINQMRRCPSWLVGEELKRCVPSVGVLVLEFFPQAEQDRGQQ